MVKQEPEKPEESGLNLEKGSVKLTLRDVYVMFYVLVKQNQQLHPGSKMSFDLNIFKSLPKKIAIHFERKHGRLFAWIPGKRKERKKKSRLLLPESRIII